LPPPPPQLQPQRWFETKGVEHAGVSEEVIAAGLEELVTVVAGAPAGVAVAARVPRCEPAGVELGHYAKDVGVADWVREAGLIEAAAVVEIWSV
jgi:hypothetical protein